MPNTDINIILSLVDKASSGFKRVSDSLEEASRSMKSFGREVSQVGSTLTMTGGIITSAFAVAVKNSSQNIAEINQVMLRVENTLDLFQEKVATAALPVVEKFSNALNQLFNAFNSLSPEFQNAIIQGTLLSGIFLTLGGGILMITGKIIALIGNLGLLASSFLTFAAANAPFMILLAVVVGIAAAMMKWKDVADIVLSTFQALFIFLQNGFLSVKVALEGVMFGITQSLQVVVDLIARIPGPAQTAMQILSNEVQNASNNIRNGINQDLSAMVQNVDTLDQIFQSGEGSWSQWFDDLKIKISEVMQKFGEGNNAIQTSAAIWKKNYDGVKSAVMSLQSALANAAAQNKSLAVAAQAVAIGMAIMNTAEGVTRAFKDYMWPFSMIVAGIIGAAGAVQIAAISSQKFSEGTDTVPAMLTPGEMVVPRTMADAIRSGDIQISGRGNSGRNREVYNHIEIYYPQMNNQADISSLAEQLGFEIDRNLRNARSLA